MKVLQKIPLSADTKRVLNNSFTQHLLGACPIGHVSQICQFHATWQVGLITTPLNRKVIENYFECESQQKHIKFNIKCICVVLANYFNSLKAPRLAVVIKTRNRGKIMQTKNVT